MSLRNIVACLAAALAVAADSSHPMHYQKVDAETAKSVAAVRNHASGRDGALVNEQGFWFSHFTVGASENLELLIDTGSSDAMLNPGIYKPSSTSKDLKRRFSISYATTNPDGSGSLSAFGKVYRDVITQLGANLVVPQQAIGAIDDPKTPATFPRDGLIGYAGKGGAALHESSFFFSLCASNALSECRFGLALRTDGTGQLHYGTVVKEEFVDELTTVDLTGYWSVNGGVTVNGKVIADNLNLVTDSGTTVIFGPTSVVREVYKSAGITEVSTANGIEGHYSCSNPPVIGFNLGGKNFNIDPKALAFKKEGDNCTASLMGTEDFGTIWLVGQAFFQGRYIDHNGSGKTMGFADLK
ncbi:aspartyl protease [Beauveria brongniartii RCEF 3172]|uniref:Aspartyl protease n=1 Tax=Beauveria brongniartii RCEF 3172 TaxID=1081107 RepID=A0A167B088_9HYPO|nr:aspartyl protease [Beauveria brongniartii RCEF 3172]